MSVPPLGPRPINCSKGSWVPTQTKIMLAVGQHELSNLYFIKSFLMWRFLPKGPTSSYMEETYESCRESWWKNMLYINNFLDTPMCLGQGWWGFSVYKGSLKNYFIRYLAVDFQMFIISPLVLFPLYKWPKIGLSLGGLLIIVATIIPMSLNIKAKGTSFSGEGYTRPWARYQPHIIGILVGYFLYIKKDMKVLPVHRFLSLWIWIIALATGFLCVLGVARWDHNNRWLFVNLGNIQ